jgi:hypothetical protein
MKPNDKQPKPNKPGQPQQQQSQTGEGKQYGEGNYKATRQYNEGLKDHVEHHDIEREARDAAPRTASEEQEMQEAERVGRSKSRNGGEESADDSGNPRDRKS